MGSLRGAVRMFSAAADSAAAPAARSRWEALKGSKAVVWCRSLVSDYKEACREVVVGAWERPVRASLYAALMGGAWACFHTAPDLASFEAALLERSNRLGLLSAWIRNGAADGHVQSLAKLRDEGRLRHASLGLLTLLYSTGYHPDSALYESQCSNVSAPWSQFHRRVLDVGFAGRWWILDSKMRNYDVNQEEFKHLPAHMQEATWPGAQEVERNQRLHTESWLPLRVEEEEEEEEEEEKKAESQTTPQKEQQIQV